MKKTIEIKHDVGMFKVIECGFLCNLRYDISENWGKCYFDFMDGKKPTDKCPGPGKYRMSLEVVDEIKCEKCGYINYATQDEAVVKCEECFIYVRSPGLLKDE